MVELPAFNRMVEGSIPSDPTVSDLGELLFLQYLAERGVTEVKHFDKKHPTVDKLKIEGGKTFIDRYITISEPLESIIVTLKMSDE